MKKYELPTFLIEAVSQGDYERWLDRKAKATLKRDKSRGIKNITGMKYKEAIHLACIESKGIDAYTGEKLDWSLINTNALINNA